MSEHAVPFHLPEIGEEEIRAVTETLRSGWLTTGQRTKQFEQEFAQAVHATHGSGNLAGSGRRVLESPRPITMRSANCRRFSDLCAVPAMTMPGICM
ncbi:MAG: hypothetical protein E8D43_11105 [Nitrospira sp.]|nr:MAG: hypothetical protein E8D43_11105 [Nitrospira sp.]